MRRFLLPLGIFIGLVIFLGIGLNLNPKEVPSPLIGKPAPQFSLTSLSDPSKVISPKQMLGQVWMLNVWASWCVACRYEHPILIEMAKKSLVPIIGLDYKDVRADGLNWLAQFGNPYQDSAFDEDGRVGIDYGVYGVPETFLIDKQGIIRLKHIGPITPEVITQKLQPMILELNRG
ncbi:MAG: DsbE family thiol:disulfide interchange protein [Burkholderiaceae bacterium]|nr:DsbE family thiol:disulfide interchange protein [Burkholderiaceae bacterium]